MVLPAHTQGPYLAEIGCAPGAVFDDARFESAPAAKPITDAASELPMVFFTSGSTGAPKRVERRLSQLETEAHALHSLWGGEAGHVRATVSHQHIYGLLFRIVWALMSGRTTDDAPATYWEDLSGRFGAGVTLVSSPAHLTRLPPRADFFADAPPLVFSSGQLLPADAAAACKAAFGRAVIEVLGSTETGGVAWRRQNVPDGPWTPLPNVNVSESEDGALEVRSPFLAVPGPHRTGDGVRLFGDGHFVLQPRQDRVVKIDGKRVSLPRVEEALLALPHVATAAALTLPDRHDALAAIVTLKPEGTAQLDALGAFRLSRDLRTALAETLEPAERPKHWRFADIPTDAQGKRVLATLRAMFEFDALDVLKLDMRKQTDREAEIAFDLPPELIFFEGHFPERAILPGVAQAHMAVLFAKKLWGEGPSDANLSRLKFKRVLVPGDPVVLKLKRDPSIGRLSFSYQSNEEDVSQGEIGGVTR